MTELGNLLETFVVGELPKQVSRLDEQVSIGHWRTRDGDEVEFVIEFDDSRVLAFEVRANEHVRGRYPEGLRKPRDFSVNVSSPASGSVRASARTATTGERLHVMPIDRLWAPAS
ncbi:DUF4143 domain-containing protein [uncultured Friedmanniella sp.]|uniref:DUF4143 domain-containing protein n=1 Tax=uncultured Friedmanniella sp. TaxID=335381 RepID=UPI0035CAE651